MKPLFLTGWMMPDFKKEGLADIALDLAFFALSGDRSPRWTKSRAISALAAQTPAGHTLVGLGWLLEPERK